MRISPALRTARRTALFFLLLPLAAVEAQGVPKTIAPVSRVRSSVPAVSKSSLTGKVVSLDSVAIMLLPGPRKSPIQTLPWTEVQKIELSQGHHWSGKRTATGAGIGLLAGAVVGLLIGVASVNGSSESMGVILAPVAGAFLGLPIGAFIGAVPQERWETLQ